MNCIRLLLPAIAGVLLAGATARAELRALAHVEGRVIPVTGVENNRIVGTEDGRKIALLHDTVYELEGDLRAEAALVRWSSNYASTSAEAAQHPPRPGIAAVGTVNTRHLVELDGKKMTSEFRAAWPAETGEGGLMLMGWVVDGKISQLAVAKVPATRTAKFFVVMHEFELTSAEAGGQGIMLLWEQGRFIPPKLRFDDARAQSVLAPMLLGDNAPLQAALAAGMKPTVKGVTGETLLHLAAEAGAVDAMDLLLKQGAKVNATTDRGHTPLHLAAENGRLAAVERLLAANAAVNLRAGGNQTALLAAVKSGHRTVAQALVNKRADVNAANDNHESPYTVAIDRGYADLAAQMLDHGANRNYDHDQMQRVLLTQAAKGNTAMVRFLLSQKVSPRAEFEGTRALGAAAVAGDGELVGVLLQGGAGIDDASADGSTALMVACGVGRIESVQALLDAGANVNLRAKDGRTALSFAAIRNMPELVELLLARGADLSVRDASQHAPLDLALLAGAPGTARVLGDHGATIDLKSPRSAILLEAALKLNLAGIVRAALAAGWSPATRFHEVWPALAVARACQADECAAALEQAGADRSMAGAPVIVAAREIDAPPRLVAGVAPEDPRDPDAVFPASVVEVNVVLDAQGRVRFPVIGAGVDRSLGYAASKSVSAWRFTPVRRAGQPVAVRLMLPVEFPASTDLAIKPEQADLLPLPVSQTAPEYPGELSSSGKMGRVTVAFTVGKDGRVRDPRVRLSSNPAFRQPAIDAILKWVFKPGKLDGQPVAVRFEQEIVFSLQ